MTGAISKCGTLSSQDVFGGFKHCDLFKQAHSQVLPNPSLERGRHQFHTSKSVYRSSAHVKISSIKFVVAPEGAVRNLIN